MLWKRLSLVRDVISSILVVYLHAMKTMFMTEMEDLNVALVSIPNVVTGALVGRSTNVHAETQQSEPS